MLNRSTRFAMVTLAAIASMAVMGRGAFAADDSLPNFVLIFADDQGYQDIGCFGSPRRNTQGVRSSLRSTSRRV